MSRLPQQVEGDGVLVRRYAPDDAEVLHELVLANLEHLRPWMAWITFEPIGLEARRELLAGWDAEWRSGGDLYAGIWVDDRFVGSTGLHRRLGPDALEIGYWIGADFVGRGLATAATRAITDLAFTVPDIQAVEIHHDVTNRASRRVPEKLGYEPIGEIEPNRPVRAPAETGVDLVWRMARADWVAGRT